MEKLIAFVCIYLTLNPAAFAQQESLHGEGPSPAPLNRCSRASGFLYETYDFARPKKIPLIHIRRSQAGNLLEEKTLKIHYEFSRETAARRIKFFENEHQMTIELTSTNQIGNARLIQDGTTIGQLRCR